MYSRSLRKSLFLLLAIGVSIVGVGCLSSNVDDKGKTADGATSVINYEISDESITETPVIILDPSPTLESVLISPTAEIERDNNTSTPIEPPNTLTRFAVIGDYGLSKGPERDVANLVKSWEPDFIITVGDNNYPDGTAETIDENIGQYYGEFIYHYVGDFGDGSDVNRFFPILGNHDWTTAGGQPYYDYFTLPGNERYYDFVWGDVHFFALNSDSREPDGVGLSSVQAQWFREKIAGSSAPWKIVYMHHPPYSSSGDGSITWMQWPFKEWGADAVMTGHSHVYERLIVGDFPYFINGLGGGPRYSFDSSIPSSQVRYRDEYGAMLVDANPELLVFHFITRGTEILDAYEIGR